ncbi:hypothetical protein B296_00049687 [Ensete ventricosum]|uniref:Uncharacterized protein n=1 Tax=Ensete ventricosum TaxID=4639 RepID=A0A426WZ49_ENSVE|nr:hypothetical protein B296_00049687 [Ensete ventricosum]
MGDFGGYKKWTDRALLGCSSICGWFYGTPEKIESACLGPAHVRKLVFVNQEEVVKFRTGRSDRFGSESWVPPSRDLSKDPTQRPRRDRSVRRDPSNDQVSASTEIVLRV